MALIESLEKSGNWLFRWRSFMPLVLYVLALGVMLMGWDDHFDHRSQTWIWVCLSVSLLGLYIRVVTIGYTPRGTSGRNTKEGQVAESLNTKGVYSVVRHPLYLGNYFMWLGIILYVGNAWFALGCSLLFWVYYERIMFAEEAFLQRKFGGAYFQWSRKVPAFWPKMSGFVRSGVHFSMKNVLRREYSGFLAIFVSFALLDVVKNVRDGYAVDLFDYVQPFWFYATTGAAVVALTLRTMKKRTKLLVETGREYT